MPVYPVAAQGASCASPGCCCRERVPRYPSDLTEQQWKVLEPRAREVMRELLIAEGRPMVHDLRAVCDAVAYVVRNGIEWRALPVDFPPWEAVYAFYERWNKRGLPLALVHRLRERLRDRQGRNPQPTACIVDSQIVKCADTVATATRGYHGGKKITGRGRHLAVDTEGWLLALVVTAASVSDKAGLKLLVIRLFNTFSTLKIMWADSGHDGAPIARWVKTVAAITLEVVRNASPRPPQMGRRAHLRLADAMAPPGAGLRTPHQPSRGHGLLGHRLHHDQTACPLPNRPAAHTALGRRPQATGSASPGSGMKSFINRLLDVGALGPETGLDRWLASPGAAFPACAGGLDDAADRVAFCCADRDSRAAGTCSPCGTSASRWAGCGASWRARSSDCGSGSPPAGASPWPTGSSRGRGVCGAGGRISTSMAITASPAGPIRSRVPRRMPARTVSTETSNASAVSSTRIQSSEARGAHARAIGGPSSLTVRCSGAEPYPIRPKCSSVSSGCNATWLSAARAGSATDRTSVRASSA